MNQVLKNKSEANAEKDNAYINVIADEYSLSDLNLVGVSEKGVSSYNVIVEASDGRRFFVKQYKEDDADRRENCNLVERHIASHSSIPIVLPLETTSGNSHTCIDGKTYAVFVYQEHNEDLPSTDAERQTQAFNLAKVLGSIHSVSTEDLNEQVGAIDRWRPREVADRIVHLETLEKAITDRNSLDDFDEIALKVIAERKKLLSALDVDTDIVVTNTICHGDYHSQNVLFDDNFNVTGVIDWDICAKSDPYVDFLNTFKMTVIGRKYDTFQQERREIAKVFLEGYLAGSNFDFDRERLRNAANTLTQVIVGSSWPLDEHYFMNYTKADSHLDKELDKAKFFSENRDVIVSFILDMLDDLETNH